MEQVKLTRAQLDKMVEVPAQTHKVVGPKKKATRYAFEEVKGPEEIEWGFDQTIQSPKAFFFPPVERLLKYSLSGAPDPEKTPVDERPVAIVGAHPCDINATCLLDEAFSASQNDPFYQARREQSIMVGLDCVEPCDEMAFCKQMGTNVAKEKYDLLLTRSNGGYIAAVGSEKGKELLSKVGATEKAGQKEVDQAKQAKERGFQDCDVLKARLEDLPQLLEDNVDHPVWEEIAERCFACGSCTMVCPTCYCFDVKDDPSLTMESAERWRRWDGCVLKGFAEVAGGEDFREHKADRLRHRFFRKGKYILERLGKPGCVGCGRCSRTCLAQIYAHETFNALTNAEEKAHERVS